MVDGAEQLLADLVPLNSLKGPAYKIPNDPRITRVGRWLRRWSIDELPQFWNILKGEMSLVGPRPERPEFVEKFSEEIVRYLERHKVAPGVTGWAQVNGLRGRSSIKERIKYDLYYRFANYDPLQHTPQHVFSVMVLNRKTLEPIVARPQLFIAGIFRIAFPEKLLTASW
jgi:lipopolysaccharide/colanic/teichoic acid biosynthesis glycosyltransferase